MKYLKVLFLLLFISSSINYSQDFGEVSEQELQMSECKEEPDADVIVLLDICDVKITNNFELEIEYHKRVKVLTEEGKKYANVKINFWHEDHINRIEAASYSKDGNEYELDDDNIFEEEGEKINTTSFAIPNVTVGSVIEYKYRHWSKYLTRLPAWVFQGKNLTKFSKYQVTIPAGFSYKIVRLNTENYDIKESSETIDNYDNSRKQAAQYTWIGKNLPGLKDEKFVDNIDDKYARMIFIMDSYKSPYTHVEFAESWDNIAERVSKKYDDLIEQDGPTEEKAKILVGSETDELKKANIIYEFVKNEIKTSDHKALLGDDFKEPEEVLESHEGSSSEKDLLLINMLSRVGLDAKPVFISTRGNGMVVAKFPEVYQFNRVICQLTINRKEYYLYTDSKYIPFGNLTPATDVGLGLLIDEGKGKIISVNPTKPFNKVEYKSESTIQDENNLTANSVITYYGYSAYLERNSISDKNEESMKENVEDIIKKINPTAELDSFYYSGIEDIDNPLVLNVTYNISDYINESGDLVYFTMPLFTAKKSNPFQKEKRYFDIDFDYPEQISEEIKLNIPSNLSLLEIPNKNKDSIDKYTFSKYYFSTNDYINCYRLQNIQARQFSVKYYDKLKNLYSGMITSDEEQLVFKKLGQVSVNDKK